jgi:hypothetical protein
MENEPSPPRRRLLLKIWPQLFLVCSMLVLVAGLWLSRRIYERGRARPELHVKNSGTVTVMLHLGKDRVVAQPDQEWVFKFSPGDSLEVFAGGTESGKSKTVALHGEPYEKVQAEVSADNDGQINFELTPQK